MNNAFVLNAANIVILANNYNPSIISKEWLYEKNIIRDEVINFAHTPPFSLIETKRISFVVDESRLQISLRSISLDSIGALPKIAADFARCLPETPFVAVGFNYRFQMPKGSTYLETLFSPNDAKLKELFSEDYGIGSMVSFRFKEFVVTMSAPPPKGDATNVMINFNFHSDCHGAEAVKERLELHPQTMERAEEILRRLSG